MKESNSVTLNRNLCVDRLKAFAIVCVLFIHCCDYSDPIGSVQWTSALVWGSLARAAVPLFLMCSGVLMLPPEKDLPLKKLFGRNLLRLLVSMWVWAMLYKVFYLLAGHTLTPAALWQSVKEVLVFNQEFHFYYIHIMLLVYLFLPVARVFLRQATRRELEYALLFWLAFGILYPTLLPYWPFRLITGFPLQYHINMTYAAIGYGLFGYYLSRYPLPRKTHLPLLLCGLAVVFGGTFAGSLRRGYLYEGFLQGMALGVCLMAAGIFSLFLRHPGPSRWDGAVTFLSKASFCVYLVHVFFLRILPHFGLTAALLPKFFSIPLLAAAVLSCSLAVYWVLSRIPVVNRWLL